MTCAFCGQVIVGVRDAGGVRPVEVAEWRGRPGDRGKARVGLGRHRYVIDGRIGRGDSCEVFLAHRDARLGERVVLKVLCAEEDRDLLAREWEVLEGLRASEAEGAAFFVRLLPRPVATGRLRLEDGDDGPLASAFGFRPGFEHTFEDIRAAHPRGIDPRHAAWMWRRVLQMLGWIHRAGVVHGGVHPAHLLVGARARGVLLLGWGTATRAHQRTLPARSKRYAALYPRLDGPPTPALDLSMAARSIAWILGDQRFPEPLAALLAEWAERPPRLDGRELDGRELDGWALEERVDEAARRAFGPPRFVELSLPSRFGPADCRR